MLRTRFCEKEHRKEGLVGLWVWWQWSGRGRSYLRELMKLYSPPLLPGDTQSCMSLGFLAVKSGTAARCRIHPTECGWKRTAPSLHLRSLPSAPPPDPGPSSIFTALRICKPWISVITWKGAMLSTWWYGCSEVLLITTAKSG